MKFYVQSITKVPSTLKTGNIEISEAYVEIDLVDAQLTSDWQSSITLRLPVKAANFYHIGQCFELKRNRFEYDKHHEAATEYFNDIEDYHEGEEE